MMQINKDMNELLTALTALPVRCREVFILCKLEGYKHTEVAEQMGISVSTVEKHMVKALKLCRSAIKQEPHPDADSQNIPAESGVENKAYPEHVRRQS
jgi:RNA polymerase sigma-70 factor (ECF subfamily)